MPSDYLVLIEPETEPEAVAVAVAASIAGPWWLRQSTEPAPEPETCV